MKNRPTPLRILCALAILSAFLCYPSVSQANDKNENATITVNASLLTINLFDLKKETGLDPTSLTLKSIPITKILWCIAKDKCIFTNGVTLTMTNNGHVEYQSQEDELIDSSNGSGQVKSEHIFQKTSSSYKATSSLKEDGKIVVTFEMTTTKNEEVYSKYDAKDKATSKKENISGGETIKISCETSLKPDTPTIVTAIKTKAHVDLLILTAEID